MSDRERLLQILNVPIHPNLNVDPLEAVADYLLDNGVTFAKDTNVPSWIPVSERLPDEVGEYLVVVLDASGQRYSDYADYADYDLFRHRWTTGRFLGVRDKITHWMPLPEPPKEDGHD